MNILSAENISKSYSEKVLFKDISLGINEGDKIGLIGINGTGKSTLLKIIAGCEYTDSGKIIKGNNINIEYLSQETVFENSNSVIEHIFKGNSPVMQLIREYEYTLNKYNEAIQINDSINSSKFEKKLFLLNQKMDSMDAWNVESQVKTILTKLGIKQFDTKVNILSGGQKKRVAMASALINESDLLILDEPTNHIDNTTVTWLENYINSRKGALLMVTHDRYFLDRVCNKIIELDDGSLYTYQGNYTKYLEMKAEREEIKQAIESKRQNLLRKELAWIKRGAKARSTKQKARIDRYEKLSEQQFSTVDDEVEIETGFTRLGKKTIEINNVSKSFDNINLINEFSYLLLRDDRIGIIGQNGSGKSTLLNMIVGKVKPDKGTITIGETVKIGFFSQENDGMDENLKVIEYIRDEAEFVNTPNGTISASQMLERFLFPPSVQWTPISKLSGGEKRRLFLLRMLMSAPNIILLDEPTNDLDIKTLTILESYLDNFKGAVIAVSHDRYFLDRTVDKLFVFEGNQNIKIFQGNYSEYFNSTNNIKNDDKKSKKKQQEYKKENKQLKFTYKERLEFENIDQKIADLEQEIEKLNTKMNEVSSDFDKLQEILKSKEVLERQLDETMERWVYLNELAEKIETQKNKF